MIAASPRSIPAYQFWPGFGEHRNYAGIADPKDWLANVGSRGESYLFAVPLVISDGGRAQSRRPKQRADCTVRALAHCTGEPYDACYDALAAGGRKSGRGFHLRQWAQRQGNFAGWRFDWRDFPAVKGMPRVTPVTFALARPTGRFILRCAGHVMACVDGVIMDGFRPNADACVYGALELRPA